MMRRTARIVLAVILCGVSGLSAQDKDIKSLAAAFADSLSKKSKKTVAVVDFNDLQGNVTELGRYLAEQVSVALASTDKGIEVVDRTHLKTLLQEHKLNSSGLIDPATARKLGQIAGVEILVTGTITPFGESVQLAVKALDTTTARIVSASTIDIAKTKTIEELLNRGINTNPSATQQTSEPPAGNTSTAKQGPLTVDSTGQGPSPSLNTRSYSTESYTVTVNAVRKISDTVIVTLTFEGTSATEIKLSWDGTPSGTYLLDEAGEKWEIRYWDHDKGKVLWFPGFGPTDLLPRTKLRTEFRFVAKESNQGKVFTLVGKEGQPRDRRILIRGLRAE